MLYHRHNDILVNSGGSPAWGASYTVTVYSVGARANASSSDTTVPVDAGHSFTVGDKIYNYNEGTFSGALTAVTATQLTAPGNFSVSSGDLLVNVGADTGTTSPNWDGSNTPIFSDPDGSTAVSNSRVTADSLGNYTYSYKGDGAAWELIRDTSGTVQKLIEGSSAVANRANAADFGAAVDGSTDDSKAINAALLAAGQNGGTVYVPAGTALLDSDELDINDAGVTLCGAGSGETTLKAGSNQSFNNGSMLQINADDSTVRDLYFDADLGTVDASHCIEVKGTLERIRIIDCFFDGADTYGFRCQGSGGGTNTVNELWIERCQFDDCKWGIAIVDSNSTNIYIQNCSVDYPNRSAADVRNGIMLDRNVSRATISGCECNKGRFGIALASVTDVLVDNCICRGQNDSGTAPQGIHVEYTTGETQTRRVTITDCIVSAVEGIGIDIEGVSDGATRDVVVKGCIVHSCSKAGTTPGGIFLDDVQDAVIESCVIYNNDGQGILLASGNSLTKQVKIRGNTSFNNNQDTGGTRSNIRVGGNCTQVDVVGNHCYDDQGTPTAVYGISVSGTGTSDIRVEGNWLDGNHVTDEIDWAAGAGVLRDNFGHLTENSGTANIASGNTSVTVSHGLGETPSVDDFSLLYTEDPDGVTADPGKLWVDTITSTQFNINCQTDPSTSGVTIAWRVAILNA